MMLWVQGKACAHFFFIIQLALTGLQGKFEFGEFESICTLRQCCIAAVQLRIQDETVSSLSSVAAGRIGGIPSSSHMTLKFTCSHQGCREHSALSCFTELQTDQDW